MSEKIPNPSVAEVTINTETWVSTRTEGALTVGVSKKGTEWILSPNTKDHLYGPFSKIEDRGGVLVGKGRLGEDWLDPSTGKPVAGPFAMDSVKLIGEKYVVANGKNGGKFFLFNRSTGKEVGDGHFTSIEITDGKIIGKRIAKKDGRETSEVLAVLDPSSA